jgi:hypothetical protein
MLIVPDTPEKQVSKAEEAETESAIRAQVRNVRLRNDIDVLMHR